MTVISGWTNQDVKNGSHRSDWRQCVKKAFRNSKDNIDWSSRAARRMEQTLKLKNMFDLLKFREELDKLLGHKSGWYTFNIVQLLSSNKCWTRLRLVEYSFNFYWATSPYFENSGRWNVVIALCCESWCCAKRKKEKFELEMAIQNKISFGTFTIHLQL